MQCVTGQCSNHVPNHGIDNLGPRRISNEAEAASHRFVNLSWKSFEASDRVIFLIRMLLPSLSDSDLRTGFGYCVRKTRSQNPLVIP